MKFSQSETSFYLIRHAETEWNRLDRLQGQTDIPLNPLGLQQAEELGKLMQSFPVDEVIASDLIRAVQTAQSAFPHLPVTQDPRFREILVGQAEGLHRSELLEQFGAELLKSWALRGPASMNTRFPGGETKMEALTRARQALVEHLSAKPKKRMAFVSHGMIIRLLTEQVTGTCRDEWRAPNCSVYHFSHRYSENSTTQEMLQHFPEGLRLNQIFHLVLSSGATPPG